MNVFRTLRQRKPGVIPTICKRRLAGQNIHPDELFQFLGARRLRSSGGLPLN
jgi:hypothetical protein